MANLIVEIGNTALKAAWTEGMTLGRTFRYQGEKVVEFILSLLEKSYPEVLAIASVREIGRLDEEQFRSKCGELLIMDSNHPGIRDGYGFPGFLSYDRAAGLLAASYMFEGKACTVFDFGTTMTVDFLSSDGKYEGGNISPGCRTRFKALNRYSRNLPLVNTPAEPAPTGTSLESSIESGVISGIMFEIEGYIHQKPDNIIIFTGGDAIYFAKRMKNSIFAVSNLVLMGLALITENYVKKNHI